MAAPTSLASQAWWLLRVPLALLFAYTGIMKALEPAQFATELTNYRLVSPVIAAALALYIPWAELSCAVGLLLQRLRRGAWLLAFLLSIGFFGFVASAWARGLDISCGCFGPSSGPIDGLTIVRTGALALLTCLGLARDGAVRPTDRSRLRQPFRCQG